MDKKYIGLIQNYLEKLNQNIGDSWRTDELFLNETRFWIAELDAY